MSAQSDQEARVLLEQNRFDLVIVDWHLGGTDGLDLLRFVKDKYSPTPTIVYTGATVPLATLKQVLAQWADVVMLKMGPLQTLLAEVRRLIASGEVNAEINTKLGFASLAGPD